jgi:hypothetical protein
MSARAGKRLDERLDRISYLYWSLHFDLIAKKRKARKTVSLPGLWQVRKMSSCEKA